MFTVVVNVKFLKVDDLANITLLLLTIFAWVLIFIISIVSKAIYIIIATPTVIITKLMYHYYHRLSL